MGDNSKLSNVKRTVALIGPFGSGKTSLLEALLAHMGKINRAGSVDQGNSVGDTSKEARAHNMSVEVNIANGEYLGDEYCFIDCPGSIEFLTDMQTVLPAVDAAVVVCDPDESKTLVMQLIFHELEKWDIPHFVFVNKIDTVEVSFTSLLETLQPVSKVPLVLRQIPIREDDKITGFVDLALERAFVYKEGKNSEIIEFPTKLADRKDEARYNMLEQLADYDDELMEQLLEDATPPRDLVFNDLREDLAKGVICPVLLGSALKSNGITRLLKALRHEMPAFSRAQERFDVSNNDSAAILYVMKTFHTAHGGKLSIARLLAGELKDGMTLKSPKCDDKITGTFEIWGQEPKKVTKVNVGDVIGLGKMDNTDTSMMLTSDKKALEQLYNFEPMQPIYGMAIFISDQKDEVKLSSAIHKLIEEDPSLKIDHNQDTNEFIMWGQGEMQLRITLERLESRFGIKATTKQRTIPYKETITKSVEQRGRHKKQSGGHGQFGDVVIDIKPLPNGEGFKFTDTITGGVVPKQYIPSVEAGISEYMKRGPLGFPVVDVAVNLKDGSYHSVDSSDMAFKQAGRIAMNDGLKNCNPVILEPFVKVQIHVPSDITSKANTIVSSRRGQLLGFDARNNWEGWDTVNALMPESETTNMIIELRSVSAGVGTFEFEFDHMSKVTGKHADEIVKARNGG